jgi:hypothetical protein
MAKAAFNKNQTILASKLDLSSKKELIKCCNLDTVFYGAVMWTLGK